MASRKKLVGNNLCFIELDPTSCETYADGMRVLGKAPTQEFRKDTLSLALGDSFRDSNSATFLKHSTWAMTCRPSRG